MLKWLSGIVASVVAAVAGLVIQQTYFDNPAIAGEIVEAKVATTDPCCEFSVQVQLKGLDGKDCKVQYTLLDPRSLQEVGRTDGVTLTPESDDDRARADVDVPVFDAGDWIVRFVVSDHKGVELDREETAVFTVTDPTSTNDEVVLPPDVATSSAVQDGTAP